ncbi:class I SAM-dependent methyltransferase [Streptomyces sp. NBC_00882]|uniref:SAM-dependent methyltransferase n=1 Tax=Streptomyces TaxID=1883 RepID=UPI00386A9448|nr:class I SAM-dependent methyltransferase [Streptomyces sp. NBC_00882]WSZ62972.1 class I SAM-dependent methyltransferase [Streptomyces canus]
MFGNSPIRAHSWWHGFYADRSKPVPSFVPKPDEKLGSYLDRGLITPVRALDLGCGRGRNALHLGFEVDAVARERAHETTADVRFVCGDAFALPDTGLGCPYDLIYDSGCFHHLPPHRRVSYLALLERHLAPGGRWPRRQGRLDGGLAYSAPSLRRIFRLLLLRRTLPPGRPVRP